MGENTENSPPEALHKVARAGEVLGDFTRIEIKDNLRLGQFLRTDHVWAPGVGRWMLLSELMELSGSPPTAAPSARSADIQAKPTEEPEPTLGFFGSISKIFTWIFVLMIGGLIGAILEGRNPRRHPENDPLHDPYAGKRDRDYDDPYA